MYVFLWDDWNTGHIAEHGVEPQEAEFVVRNAKAPYPRDIGDGKSIVWGQSAAGRYLQVIFVLREAGEIAYESLELEQLVEIEERDTPVYYIIHAMELTPKMKRQLRKRRS